MRITRWFLGRSVMVGGLLATLTGCGSHEILNVPDHSAMVGQIHLDQPYELQRDAQMAPISQADASPSIDVWYAKSKTPPAEAFERVPLPIDAPGADTYGWSYVTLHQGTRLSITLVQIYQTCHVYIGRILTGNSTNVHLLFVVPIGSSSLPSLPELQSQDGAYLQPITIPASTPSPSTK
jgi:hypothetical protein